MKTKKILIAYIFFITAFCLFPFGKKKIDYSEYENFLEQFFETDSLSFDTIQNEFYDEHCCVRLIFHYYSIITKEFIESDQIMAFPNATEEEICRINNILESLGTIKNRKLTESSIKNIYDLPVSDLYCFTYEGTLKNKSTIIEQFWLKKKDGKICIYRYTIGVDVYK